MPELHYIFLLHAEYSVLPEKQRFLQEIEETVN